MNTTESYHFIGIAGAGMSALARILSQQGVRVSGSEMADSPTRVALEHELNIIIPAKQVAQNIEGATLVVASAAVKETNPELAAARRLGIPVLSRAQMLGRVMDLYANRIAVSGTHGKTTTSAMIAVMLESAGLDPTALIGGDVPSWHSNARLGHGPNFVAEACEAYSSFLELRPTISVITNVEADHLDHYGSMGKVVEAFEAFVAATKRLGVLWAEDPYTEELTAVAKCRVTTFGFTDQADLMAAQTDEGTWMVYHVGDPLGELHLTVPGNHNILNALAAVAVGLELGIPFAAISHGLSTFAGTGRRFERLGDTEGGVTVIDDYAHHPTEIRATLAAAKQAYPGRRIVAVFQPHLPSRTRDLMDEFAHAFGDADLVVLTDVYLAREPYDPQVTGRHLADRTIGVIGAARLTYVADKTQLPTELAKLTQRGDVLLTLGAGDIRAAGEGLRPAPTAAHLPASGPLPPETGG